MDSVEKKQIEELYLEMFDKLLTYSLCALKNQALAEEAVQETFRIACQKPESLCNSPNPQGWLVLTLKNTIRNMKSSRVIAQRILEEYMKASIGRRSPLGDEIDLHLLYENVAHTEEFNLLWEMVVEGRSHEEMAKARGISISACKKRVERAKKKLQKRIKI